MDVALTEEGLLVLLLDGKDRISSFSALTITLSIGD